MATIGTGYAAYSLVRVAIRASRHAALAHAAQLWTAERWLHLDAEPYLNHLAAAHAAVSELTGYYYGLLHFLVTPLALAWLYLSRPAAFPRLRSALVITTAAANVVFWAWPVAPPRFSVRGMTDVLVTRDILGAASPHGPASLVNLYAAMPSLHVAWAAWCAIAAVTATRARWRHLAWIYPAATMLVVLATANHFVLDVAGGLAATGLGMIAASRPGRLPGRAAKPASPDRGSPLPRRHPASRRSARRSDPGGPPGLPLISPGAGTTSALRRFRLAARRPLGSGHGVPGPLPAWHHDAGRADQAQAPGASGYAAQPRQLRKEEPMRVLVAGASGAIGMPVVRLLRHAGHEVIAVHRAPEGRARLAEAGAAPVQADVLDRRGLSQALDGQQADAVISELTALKKIPLRHQDMAATNRLRTEGTANLLAAAAQLGAPRFITQSMVFGYGFGDWGGRVLTEADPFAPPGNGRFEAHLAALRANEEQVLGAECVDGIALRYGQLYGPGPASDALVAALRRRRLPVTRTSGAVPWVYIDDAASATVAALELGERGAAYNITDDEPVSMPAMLTAIAAAVGAPRPWAVPGWLLTATPFARAIVTGGLRVSNTKAKAELSWELQAPTYRDGLRFMARHYRP